MKKCKQCEKLLSGRQVKYCSVTCACRGSASAGGKASIEKNRPRGESHYLWKGGKSGRKEWRASYKTRFPERVRAREMVTSRIKRGTMERLPCAVCGELKSEAHHEDYAKPLEVIWLCRKHHREADKKLGIGSRDFAATGR